MPRVPGRPITLAALLAAIGLGQPASFHLLIRNGRVLDGSGNPLFPADVAVRDGRIVAVASVS